MLSVRGSLLIGPDEFGPELIMDIYCLGGSILKVKYSLGRVLTLKIMTWLDLFEFWLISRGGFRVVQVRHFLNGFFEKTCSNIITICYITLKLLTCCNGFIKAVIL